MEKSRGEGEAEGRREVGEEGRRGGEDDRNKRGSEE